MATTDDVDRIRRALTRKLQAAPAAGPPQSTTPADRPVRRVIRPQRDPATGLVVQPDEVGPEREEYEKLRREMWSVHFAYADPWVGRSRTYDPTGNYRCGDCNMAEGAGCLLLKVDQVDMRAGSCSHWEDRCAGDAELELHELPITGAAYGKAKNGEGWGCHRCPYAEQAKSPDSMGRTLYCGKADCRVLATACCAINGAETVPVADNGAPVQAGAAGPTP